MKHLFKKTNVAKRTQSYIGTIENVPDTMLKFREFRAAVLDITGKKMMLQGRNPNRKALAIKHGVSHNRLRQNVPIKWATSFDVYWRS